MTAGAWGAAKPANDAKAPTPASGYHGNRGTWNRRPQANPAKDRTITRLAVLKAAAAFAATRTEIKSSDVLRIATSWEAWVNRA